MHRPIFITPSPLHQGPFVLPQSQSLLPSPTPTLCLAVSPPLISRSLSPPRFCCSGPHISSLQAPWAVGHPDPLSPVLSLLTQSFFLPEQPTPGSALYNYDYDPDPLDTGHLAAGHEAVDLDGEAEDR